MSHRCVLAAVVFGIASTASTARGQAPSLVEHPFVASNLRLLEVWVQAELDYHAQPGVVIGIISDQELIYAKGFGYADLESKKPMTTDTVFRIGSQSKTFTAIAVLQLQEQGRLALSDPVEKFIPGFKVKGGKTSSEPITIHQLLTHTAGLPSEGTQSLSIGRICSFRHEPRSSSVPSR